LTERINALLPQTQCTKCGFNGCLPYAQALASEQTDINRCPPGGADGVRKLAQLLDKPVKPIDPSCGEPGPLRVAVIDEQHCIGCTLCIQACPVDAIMGANKRMHTVIADWCTGCDLCLPPCPVDCIEMQPANENPQWTDERAKLAQQRHQAREQRLTSVPETVARANPSAEQKQAIVAQALARARARRGQS
jgi:electron transport complex protein RnfB